MILGQKKEIEEIHVKGRQKKPSYGIPFSSKAKIPTPCIRKLRKTKVVNKSPDEPPLILPLPSRRNIRNMTNL